MSLATIALFNSKNNGPMFEKSLHLVSELRILKRNQQNLKKYNLPKALNKIKLSKMATKIHKSSIEINNQKINNQKMVNKTIGVFLQLEGRMKNKKIKINRKMNNKKIKNLIEKI
jgi:hypothetical protein